MVVESQEGKNVPAVTLKTRVNGDFVDLNTADFFKGRTVVIFSLPGAFTPTCSSSHAPRYDELYDELKANGVDEVACISVNDAFVMNAWAKDLGVSKITMLPDGNGEFTKGMGALEDFSALGFGPRSWRYSALVKDGVVEKQFIEPKEAGDPFHVSDADTMLAHVSGGKKADPTYLVLSKVGCPFCAKAKALLEAKGKRFTEIIATQDVVRAAAGQKTWPAILVEGRVVGGFDALEKELA